MTDSAPRPSATRSKRTQAVFTPPPRMIRTRHPIHLSGLIGRDPPADFQTRERTGVGTTRRTVVGEDASVDLDAVLLRRDGPNWTRISTLREEEPSEALVQLR